DAARAIALDDHALHTSVGPDIDAASGTLLRHRLRDRAHPAACVPPLPSLAVHFAEYVMEQHIRGSWLIRTGEIADDRIEAERRLDRLGLEPAVEHVARAFRHQLEQIATFSQIELAKSPADLPRIEQRGDVVAPACADVRRRLPDDLAQKRGRAIEHRVVLRQTLGVAR